MKNEIETDMNLVAAVIAGDETAQARFYDRFKPRVAMTLHKFTRKSPMDHEDLVQTAFIQLFKNLQTFEGKSALASWVYRVAYNEGLMYVRNYRTRGAQRTSSGDDALKSLHSSHLESPAHAVNRVDLERAFRRLSRGYALAIRMHDVEGYEHSEIAAAVGWHAGTSRSQLFKARAKMRSLL